MNYGVLFPSPPFEELCFMFEKRFAPPKTWNRDSWAMLSLCFFFVSFFLFIYLFSYSCLLCLDSPPLLPHEETFHPSNESCSDILDSSCGFDGFPFSPLQLPKRLFSFSKISWSHKTPPTTPGVLKPTSSPQMFFLERMLSEMMSLFPGGSPPKYDNYALFSPPYFDSGGPLLGLIFPAAEMSKFNLARPKSSRGPSSFFRSRLFFPMGSWPLSPPHLGTNVPSRARVSLPPCMHGELRCLHSLFFSQF